MRRSTTIACCLTAVTLALPSVAGAQTGSVPAAPGGPGLPQEVLDRFRPATPTPTPTPTPAPPTSDPTPTPTPVPPAPTPLPVSPPARADAPPPSDGCTIRGTEGNDRLVGTSGRDVICGLGGNDVLLGLGGDDRIVGGAGRDRLEGGPGRDRLEARDGAPDRLNGGPGRDRAETDRRGDSVRGVERMAGTLSARAASVTPLVFHSILDCSDGLRLGSGDLMVYSPEDIIVGVRDYVWGWTGSEWRFVTADYAAYAAKNNGYLHGSDPIWWAPGLAATTALNAAWSVKAGSGYFAVTQWVRVWDRTTGRVVHDDYDWLYYNGKHYCGF